MILVIAGGEAAVNSWAVLSCCGAVVVVVVVVAAEVDTPDDSSVLFMACCKCSFRMMLLGLNSGMSSAVSLSELHEEGRDESLLFECTAGVLGGNSSTGGVDTVAGWAKSISCCPKSAFAESVKESVVSNMLE